VSDWDFRRLQDQTSQDGSERRVAYRVTVDDLLVGTVTYTVAGSPALQRLLIGQYDLAIAQMRSDQARAKLAQRDAIRDSQVMT